MMFVQNYIILLAISFIPAVVSQNTVTNLLSTLKIINRLCYFPGVNSERVAWKFIGCYDGVEGKELYFKCQKKSNGFLLDTKDRIDEAICKAPWRAPKYIQCLMREFRKAKIDLNQATAKVNACQSRAVGVSKNGK